MRCQARDLYRGHLYSLSVAWVHATQGRDASWAILSAEHGLVMPDQVLDPYQRRLRDLDVLGRAAWAARVTELVRDRFGDSEHIILAGRDYVDPLRALGGRDVFGAWRDELHQNSPGARWGIGRIKQRLRREIDACLVS